MNLDPTYKFFTETSVVVLVLFLLVLLVGGSLYVGLQLIKSNNLARDERGKTREAEEKAKHSGMELEEIRLKMLGEMTTQITSLTIRISDDREHDRQIREHDRQIREQELKAADALVKAVDATSGAMKAHVDEAVVFRATMTTNQERLLTAIVVVGTGVASATAAIETNNEGIISVKEGFKALEKALSDLPNTVKDILNPFCERIETALQKLETVMVEETHNVTSEESVFGATHSRGVPNLGIHASDSQSQRPGDDPNPDSGSDGNSGG